MIIVVYYYMCFKEKMESIVSVECVVPTLTNCIFCEKNITESFSVESHIMDHCSAVEVRTGKLKPLVLCPFCGKKMASEVVKRIHMANKHSGCIIIFLLIKFVFRSFLFLFRLKTTTNNYKIG